LGYCKGVLLSLASLLFPDSLDVGDERGFHG
jgi:hypothetical protein